MRKPENKFSITRIILYSSGLIPVIWLALRSAPYFTDNGLVGLIENAGDIFNNPFHITFVKGSLQVMGSALGYISHPKGTTGAVKSLVQPNGEMPIRSISDTKQIRLKPTRS